MSGNRGLNGLLDKTLTRRTALKGMGAAGGLALAPGYVRYAQAQSSAPIKIGFQAHRTGIGAAYGRWYEKTTNAAVKLINEAGGINGRPVEIIVEDDGTDPKRGAEVVGKFATQHKADIVFGTLFSHVVIGSAPTAGELKIPYYVVSEGHHVASTKLNRYCFQPGITDVKSQVISMAPWIASNVGKKIAMIFPDFAFGHDHRDYFTPAIKSQGRRCHRSDCDPADRELVHPLFPTDPGRNGSSLPCHGRSGRPDLREGTRRILRIQPAAALRLYRIPSRPSISRALAWSSWTAAISGRAAHATCSLTPPRRRNSIVMQSGSTRTARRWATRRMYPQQPICSAAGKRSTSSRKRWRALATKGPEDRAKLVEATEALTAFEEGKEHPQGDKTFNGKIHQCFGHQNISKVEGGKLKGGAPHRDRGRALRTGRGLYDQPLVRLRNRHFSAQLELSYKDVSPEESGPAI